MQGLSLTRGSAHATPPRDLTLGVVHVGFGNRNVTKGQRGSRIWEKEKAKANPTTILSLNWLPVLERPTARFHAERDIWDEGPRRLASDVAKVNWPTVGVRRRSPQSLNVDERSVFHGNVVSAVVVY